ncbi:PREDICTED: T-cell immunoglobulin and mucin domain-containing protein 4-like isoform X1 [Gavialis gangeticus]|uniref:T-cell immunoglobulin and mucin domain-containing protein 4-like isoform X1 n=1 Tax=Gavialis gangeticus TaxID=94835 RepID=UPI00092E4314|nr:PREDICTED: T-cell immunoglobulin and mucin domain-containing protein 4-like isoform X1 [Gavialis gangeticus]
MTLLWSSFSIEHIKLVLSGWGHSRSLSSTSMSPSLWLHWILIQMWAAHAASQTVVQGVTGQSVRLPCYYRVGRASDVSVMCWGRGSCPNSKCNNEIIRTDGMRVVSSKSMRYQLTGHLDMGDVSLTIRNVKEGDRGVYCCRIEVPGWFNDIKQNLELKVERAVTTSHPPHPPTTTTLVPAVVTTHPAMPPAFPTGPALLHTTLAPQTTDLETTEAWPGSYGVTELARTWGWTDLPATVQDPPDQTAVDYTSHAPFSTRDTPLCILAAARETMPEPQHCEPPENTDNPGQLEQGIPLLPLFTGGAVLLALLLLLLFLWRCQHKRSYQLTVTESTKPSEDPEKAFSGVEGENGLFTL